MGRRARLKRLAEAFGRRQETFAAPEGSLERPQTSCSLSIFGHVSPFVPTAAFVSIAKLKCKSLRSR